MPKGGKSPKEKGDRLEREFCKLYGGQRTYWQPNQEKEPDTVDVPYLGRGEIKGRKDGFKTIYGWLAENDFLAFRRDRDVWLVAMRMDDLKLLLDEMDQLKRQNLGVQP